MSRGLPWKKDLRLDVYLMPLLVAGFFVLQLDRSNISNALTDTLTADLAISNSNVNLGSQLMSAGIVVAEIPSNLIYNMGVWGTIALTQSLCTNIHSFLATRFLLGIWEGGYIPGGQYMLALFYTREGAGPPDSHLLLWQLLRHGFEGAITLLVFFAFIAFLPRSPSHTASVHGLFDFFTPRQREILRARIIADDETKGADKAEITLKSLLQALTDYRL
ncbi:putative transporter [Colletotrichum trifolii]|uniref:Putative transporter n=1 Tax=Colletotrichum trifolii TaxID=5466 RepID=A0A4R8R6G0_COLTR|nr:putative transporter [Colletotrichum trifolii]